MTEIMRRLGDRLLSLAVPQLHASATGGCYNRSCKHCRCKFGYVVCKTCRHDSSGNHIWCTPETREGSIC